MKGIALYVLIIVALSLCSCQSSAVMETDPPANAETESQLAEETDSVPEETEETEETESETTPAFSYDRLPEESTKEYFARVIEYEKEGLLAELAEEKESDPVWTATGQGADWNRGIAKDNYPMYNYLYSPTSPFQEGRLENMEEGWCMGDIYEMTASSLYPSNFVKYGPFKFAVTAKVVMEGDTPVMEVTECFWGSYETGDKLTPLQVTTSNFEGRIKEGSEWVLFGRYIRRDNKMTAQVRANTVYTIEDGYVRSRCNAVEFNQYDGLTPEELALTVLRIQTKYGQD